MRERGPREGERDRVRSRSLRCRPDYWRGRKVGRKRTAGFRKGGDDGEKFSSAPIRSRSCDLPNVGKRRRREREGEGGRDEMRANDSSNLEFRRTLEGRGYTPACTWVLPRASARLRNPLGAIYFPPFRATPTATANRRAAEAREGGREGRGREDRRRKKEKKGERKEREMERGNVEGGKINVQTRFQECLRVRLDGRDDPGATTATTTTTVRRAPRWWESKECPGVGRARRETRARVMTDDVPGLGTIRRTKGSESDYSKLLVR